MKTIYPIIFTALITAILLFTSCTDHKNTVTNRKDYEHYLAVDTSANLQATLAKLNFWQDKLIAAPNQITYYSKVAAGYSQLFDATGEIVYLKNADSILLKANEIVKYNSSGLLRSLARNYISQHRFREALLVLLKAEKLGDNLKDSQKMLFDVYLELGNDELAAYYLQQIKSENDFDYQIRRSKWNDHKGNLTEAIHVLEQTLPYVKESSDGLKLWTYSNLADYYGHAGLIHKSYAYYLKTLEIDPGYTYALKGIAWIVFSHEKNVSQASKIVAKIATKYHAPDLQLLQADMASYMADERAVDTYITAYFDKVKNTDYGVMYDKYNAIVLAESKRDTEKAITIAKKEVRNRPTTQSYDLLAWAYYHHGEYDTALNIIENHVYEQTSEPEVLYHIATIYKANGKRKEVRTIKKELIVSTYELGPHMIPVVQKL